LAVGSWQKKEVRKRRNEESKKMKITNYKSQITNKLQITMSEITSGNIAFKNTALGSSPKASKNCPKDTLLIVNSQ